MDKALESRLTVFRILQSIIHEGKTSDDVFARMSLEHFVVSDRQFIRLLVMTVLRHYGQITQILSLFLSKPLPKKRRDVGLILSMGVAQMVFLKTPAHATVDTAVKLVRLVKQEPFTRLVNGVLRQLDRQIQYLQIPSPICNIPDWLRLSWEHAYGIAKTHLMADAVLKTPALDITVKENPEKWAKLWNGCVLPTNSVRTDFDIGITQRTGFADGYWWVQEGAASIPVQLFPTLKGLRVADICSAPGGKTAQLIQYGAIVDAYDVSEYRLKRLMENMKRLQFEKQVRILCCDGLNILPPIDGLYDAVLLDAPCSATGTIRRHPDLLFHRTQKDIERLSELQYQLLQHALTLLKPNGYLVYSTCSLQSEENEGVVVRVLEKMPHIERASIPERFRHYCNEMGAIQTTPDMDLDGFYAVLLHKKG